MVTNTQQTEPSVRRQTPFAWMGWSAQLARDWRPLRFEGEWDKGLVIVGDGHRVAFQAKWWRPGTKRFDAGRWIARRLRRETGQSQTDAPAPQPTGFENVAWSASDESKGRRRGVWYGYAGHARLVLEVVVNGTAPRDIRDEVEHGMIPSLHAWRPDEPTRVAVFGASFGMPAGFRVQAWKMMLGDIALQLCSADRRCTIVVRQVYPAKLALARRDLRRWLAETPFREHRRFRAGGDAETVGVTVGGRRLPGLCRRGRKRLPFPLGAIGPLDSIAVAVHDAGADRLLIAEVDSRNGTSDDTAVQAIRGMDSTVPPGSRRS